MFKELKLVSILSLPTRRDAVAQSRLAGDDIGDAPRHAAHRVGRKSTWNYPTKIGVLVGAVVGRAVSGTRRRAS